MINVCYVVDASYVGGAEHYVRRIALALDRRVFAPSLVVRSENDVMAAWADEISAAGVPTTATPMSLPFNLTHARGLVRSMGASSPHIVHVNMPGPYDGQMGLVCPLARIAGAVAVVTTEHLPMVGRLWKRAVIKRFSYRFVDRVFTVCEANVPFLTGRQHVDPRRVAVVANGVREDFGTLDVDSEWLHRRYGISPGLPVVVFVGSIEHRKGLDRVLRALSGLTSSSWHLVVVGDGPQRRACEALADELGIAGRITFAGTLPPADVEQTLIVSDVLVLPSLVEGMPYVIIEAMAARTVVVSTRVAGIPEVVVHRETGLLIDAGDDPALRESLHEILCDESTRTKMAAAGRRRFEEKFTLKVQVDAIATHYKSLVGVR